MPTFKSRFHGSLGEDPLLVWPTSWPPTVDAEDEQLNEHPAKSFHEIEGGIRFEFDDEGQTYAILEVKDPDYIPVLMRHLDKHAGKRTIAELQDLRPPLFKDTIT